MMALIMKEGHTLGSSGKTGTIMANQACISDAMRVCFAVLFTGFCKPKFYNVLCTEPPALLMHAP